MPVLPGLRIALSGAVSPWEIGRKLPAAEEPTTSSTSPHAELYRLPNELVIHILASCPDFSTLWSLIHASRALSDLFDANAWAVVESILQQAAPAPLAGIIRATTRARLGTLFDGDHGPGANHLIWADSPPFRRDEIPAALLRQIVRLAHDIHVLTHLQLDLCLRRCAAMPREPPMWALEPPSANESFRVEMSFWRAQFMSFFSGGSLLSAESSILVNMLERSMWNFSQALAIQTPPRSYHSFEEFSIDLAARHGQSTTLPWSSEVDPSTAGAVSDTNRLAANLALRLMPVPIKIPNPEPIVRERYGSVWALLQRCHCCGSGCQAVTESQPHFFHNTDTPSWAFYVRLLYEIWSFPSVDKLAGVERHMRTFGLPFWDQQRMVALGFPVRRASDDYRDYTRSFSSLFTKEEFACLPLTSGHRRRDSAEDLARETWAVSHIREYSSEVIA